jgi:hypothetical protein
MIKPKTVLLLAALVGGCAARPTADWARAMTPIEGESHFAWVRQLTTNIEHGTHAEAYFSPDGKKLVLQAIRAGDKADQIYVLDIATGKIDRVSDGKGKTT